MGPPVARTSGAAHLTLEAFGRLPLAPSWLTSQWFALRSIGGLMNRVSSEMNARRRLQPYPRTLPAILMRAREAVMTRVRPVLRAYDMTEPQWRVLRTLASVEEVEVTQLAEMVFLLPSSLSRILKDLTERGMIRRRTSIEDLRKGLVSISDKGMDLIEASNPETSQVKAEIERLYGSERMDRLMRLLEELEDAVGSGQPGE
jgi:homoprotocatechuate degradation regulator HpaR